MQTDTKPEFSWPGLIGRLLDLKQVGAVAVPVLDNAHVLDARVVLAEPLEGLPLIDDLGLDLLELCVRNLGSLLDGAALEQAQSALAETSKGALHHSGSLLQSTTTLVTGHTVSNAGNNRLAYPGFSSCSDCAGWTLTKSEM